MRDSPIHDAMQSTTSTVLKESTLYSMLAVTAKSVPALFRSEKSIPAAVLDQDYHQAKEL
jgi:hypothetical protein